ncbi:Uncharacterised protein [Mycobacterium tuberculosis]|uniref:Uncharacterized protein n=1 Tax=Mycobacterium tuberculosis TaxID=1773 RepID=A0A655FVL6_MYCTX|nr:Uncharacterised protein [Mycobacterium tuberculosis]CFE50715.1 Uncharacterised protein [Mycobacterium tuberculosis]CFR91874.1 Uncharacterised protein [Mycobacterium tuberculosis]CNM32664.1 Uncharacterised protein [Mycobacterium tuberculosis]CNM72925.1 Uncharacterised protein [Mycobacterium tuberculosis]
MVSISNIGGSQQSRVATFTSTAVHGTQVRRPVSNVVATIQSSLTPAW